MKRPPCELCVGCIAYLNGVCVADECKGKIITFISGSRISKNRIDTKEFRRKSYEIAVLCFEEYFDDDFIDEDMEE